MKELMLIKLLIILKVDIYLVDLKGINFVYFLKLLLVFRRIVIWGGYGVMLFRFFFKRVCGG